MNATSHKEKAPSLVEVTGAAALVIGLISAWLYVAGWIYAYHYFDRFGIPLLMVDIPKEHYFVYSGIAARQFLIWGVIVLVLIAAIALWRRLRLDAGRLKIPLSVLALIALFLLGHQAVVVAANR